MYVTVLYTFTRFQSNSMMLKSGERHVARSNDSVDCSVTYLEGEKISERRNSRAKAVLHLKTSTLKIFRAGTRALRSEKRNM
jgi:hypothetical protein